MSAECRHGTPPALDLDGGDFARRFHDLQSRLGDGHARLPLTVSAPVAGLRPVDWLRRQPAGERAYWAARDGATELAAAGTALRVAAGPDEDADSDAKAAYDRMTGLLADADDPDLYFLGGQAFAPGAPADADWSAFTHLSFAIPAALLLRRGDEIRLVLAAPVDAETREDDLRAEFAARHAALPWPRAHAAAALPETFVRRDDLPARADWEAGVAGTLSVIGRGEAAKVVLARRTHLDFARPLDPVACLDTLARANPHSFAYLVEPRAGSAFLGVSPELLLRLEGGRLETEAIAGTAPKDGSTDLLACDKNGREHRHVLDHLVERLAGLCTRVDAPQPLRLLNLRNITHLAAGLRGELDPDRTLGGVVATLHPTPAVCGTTPAAALAEIRRREPFDRGWYTGLVGAVGRDRTELAVAIRSALVADRRLTAFAGAGIVAGSEPAQEWRELESKIRPVLDTFRGA